MHIGISTACFYPENTEIAAKRIAGLGFKQAEVFINTEAEFKDAFIDNLKEIFAEGGVKPISMHPYTSAMEFLLFFSDYSRRTEDALKQYDRYFRAAKRLGASYFTFHGARLLKPREIGGNGKTADLPPGYLSDKERAVYARLCKTASDNGITFTQENVSWCRSAEPDFIAELAKQGMKFTLDIKQAVRARIPLEKYIKAMDKSIVNIHISDYNENDSCLLPFAGAMDYNTFIPCLLKSGYNGALLIEVYRDNFDDILEIKAAKEKLELLSKKYGV